MWDLYEADEYRPCYRYYEKKRPRELEAVLVNLQTYHRALVAGTNPAQVPFRFVHQERFHGLVAIDQKGKGPNLAQTRLYVFPDTRAKCLHLLRIGDKNTQTEDLKHCRIYIERLLKRDEGDHEQAKREAAKGDHERTTQERPRDGPQRVGESRLCRTGSAEDRRTRDHRLPDVVSSGAGDVSEGHCLEDEVFSKPDFKA